MKETILVKSLKDQLSKRFLFLSLAPFIIPMILFSALAMLGGNEFVLILEEGSSTGDFSFLDESEYPIIAWLLGFGVVHWILIALLTILGTFGVILLSLVAALIVVGFLTPIIIKSVRKRHYPDVHKAKSDNIFKTLSTIAWIFLKFIGIFLFCLPFLILPFVSLFILNIPFFYLFYHLLVYDVVSNGICEDAYEIVRKNKTYIFIVMLGFFTLSLIPFMGLLLQVFFVTYLAHFIFSKAK